MKLLYFCQDDCQRCPPVKEVISQVTDIKIETIDAISDDGKFDVNMYGVQGTPAVILIDEDDDEIFSWRGITPSIEELNYMIGYNK